MLDFVVLQFPAGGKRALRLASRGRNEQIPPIERVFRIALITRRPDRGGQDGPVLVRKWLARMFRQNHERTVIPDYQPELVVAHLAGRIFPRINQPPEPSGIALSLTKAVGRGQHAPEGVRIGIRKWSAPASPRLRGCNFLSFLSRRYGKSRRPVTGHRLNGFTQRSNTRPLLS